MASYFVIIVVVKGIVSDVLPLVLLLLFSVIVFACHCVLCRNILAQNYYIFFQSRCVLCGTEIVLVVDMV